MARLRIRIRGRKILANARSRKKSRLWQLNGCRSFVFGCERDDNLLGYEVVSGDMTERPARTLRIDDETYADIQHEAKLRGLSASDWMREAVVVYMAWWRARRSFGSDIPGTPEELVAALNQIAARKKRPR